MLVLLSIVKLYVEEAFEIVVEVFVLFNAQLDFIQVFCGVDGELEVRLSALAVLEAFLVLFVLLQILFGLGLQLFLLPFVDVLEQLEGKKPQLITHFHFQPHVILLLSLSHRLLGRVVL